MSKATITKLSKANLEVAIDWLETDRKSALEHDPDCGIFANDDMAAVFSHLQDYVGELIDQDGTSAVGLVGKLQLLQWIQNHQFHIGGDVRPFSRNRPHEEDSRMVVDADELIAFLDNGFRVQPL